MCIYLFFAQETGARAIIIGKISSLPSSIPKESAIFANAEKPPKPPAGPTAPKPGPTLLKQVTAAVRLVSKSNGSKLKAKKITNRQTKYIRK